MVQRVAVIGAGCSGLTCLKTCVDEGLQPVCFESSDDIGGVWNFKTPGPGRATVYHSLVVNTSKEMMCFSDFPMPAEYPNYMRHSQLLQYFRLYAEHFDLLRHVRFKTTVKRITQRSDSVLSGQWDIVTINRDGEEESHVFDAVMVCTGHFTRMAFPLSEFPGHETFPGKCFHSWEYKDADAFRGKRVVVIGIGNSGGDIAVEVSRSAEKTFLSTRKGAWVVGRMSSNGLPADLIYITRFNTMIKKLLPSSVVNWLTERALNQHCDHRLYGLQPKHRFYDKSPLINSDLVGQILTGAVILKHNLKGFKDSGVVFDDGTEEGSIDYVIFCTGYNSGFPFLPPALSEGPHGELPLFKTLFPPTLLQPTLAIMGLFKTNGPIMTTVEMQARWAVKVFTGLCRLPSKKKMLEVIESDSKRTLKRFPSKGRKATPQIDYLPYMEYVAEQVGVRPNLLTLLLRDPVLWAKIFFGPCTPYQYRLTGPGQWAGARQAILTQWDRVAQPFRTRMVPEPESRGSILLSPWLFIFGGTMIITVLLSRNNSIRVLQGPAQILESC
ncbi:flavin-containing monooxygenase 5-like [Brachionichthys hirsutus]|uniref:flavin-containing monooxygenase 5-like n=1 Tax=Brachionichthys hirsutus TaxID=412623 RepID=UPI0036052ACA